jgi:hypothetical protein
MVSLLFVDAASGVDRAAPLLQPTATQHNASDTVAPLQTPPAPEYNLHGFDIDDIVLHELEHA